jgi:hypothetical protein
MPRDEVDVRNIVASKCVPCIALRLRDPLNSADVANAARVSATTEPSPDVVEGRTATEDPLQEQAVPLKRQADTNKIEGDHGK